VQLAETTGTGSAAIVAEIKSTRGCADFDAIQRFFDGSFAQR
jgi:hypothetical protein